MHSPPDHRETYMQNALGLSRHELEHASRILGSWAAQAQRSYFAELHRVTTDQPGDCPDTLRPELLQPLVRLFSEYDSLRLQSERVRIALDLFDTAVVPDDYEGSQSVNRTPE